MSLPSTTWSFFGSLVNFADSKISRPKTIWGLRFGISIPTALLPGMEAITLTEAVLSVKAKSSAKLSNLDTFTPGPGSISKRVITGPVIMPVTLPFTLKLSSCDSMSLPIFCNSSSV